MPQSRRLWTTPSAMSPASQRRHSNREDPTGERQQTWPVPVMAPPQIESSKPQRRQDRYRSSGRLRPARPDPALSPAARQRPTAQPLRATIEQESLPVKLGAMYSVQNG